MTSRQTKKHVMSPPAAAGDPHRRRACQAARAPSATRGHLLPPDAAKVSQQYEVRKGMNPKRRGSFQTARGRPELDAPGGNAVRQNASHGPAVRHAASGGDVAPATICLPLSFVLCTSVKSKGIDALVRLGMPAPRRLQVPSGPCVTRRSFSPRVMSDGLLTEI